MRKKYGIIIFLVFILILLLILLAFQISNYEEDIQYSEKEKVLEVFNWVINNTDYKHKIDVKGAKNYPPFKFLIEEKGLGSSREISTFFYNILKEYGIKSRIWMMKRHLVVEVYYDGGWHVFDPHLKVYFIKDGKILSMKEMEKKSSFNHRTNSR